MAIVLMKCFSKKDFSIFSGELPLKRIIIFDDSMNLRLSKIELNLEYSSARTIDRILELNLNFRYLVVVFRVKMMFGVSGALGMLMSQCSLVMKMLRVS